MEPWEVGVDRGWGTCARDTTKGEKKTGHCNIHHVQKALPIDWLKMYQPETLETNSTTSRNDVLIPYHIEGQGNPMHCEDYGMTEESTCHASMFGGPRG